MSEQSTPRTDEQTFTGRGQCHSVEFACVTASFARQLEHELAESQQAIARLMSASNQVCGQRDALLDSLHRLEVYANTAKYCYKKLPKNFAAALITLITEAEKARELIASIESNQPISTPMSERERELVNASRVVSEWAEKYSPTDSCGSEDTGAWLSSDGQEAIDGLRKSLSNYQEV